MPAYATPGLVGDYLFEIPLAYLNRFCKGWDLKPVGQYLSSKLTQGLRTKLANAFICGRILGIIFQYVSISGIGNEKPHPLIVSFQELTKHFTFFRREFLHAYPSWQSLDRGNFAIREGDHVAEPLRSAFKLSDEPTKLLSWFYITEC